MTTTILLVDDEDIIIIDDPLGAAYAAAGDFQKAVEHAQRAEALAAAAGDAAIGAGHAVVVEQVGIGLRHRIEELTTFRTQRVQHETSYQEANHRR